MFRKRLGIRSRKWPPRRPIATAHARLRRVSFLTAAGLAAFGLLLAAPAQATYSGANGPIVYVGGGGLSIHDSGGEHLLFSGGALNPDWSPDGSKVAFSHEGDIYRIDADGTGLVNLTNTAGDSERDPSWSPDGTQILFASSGVGSDAIEVMNADGSDRQLVKNDINAESPVWSPDGNTIVYVAFDGSARQIYATNSDGSGRAQLTSGQNGSDNPDFSPDGTRIAFDRYSGSAAYNEIWTMNEDGSDQQHLWGNAPFDFEEPSWSPDGTKLAFMGPQGSGWGVFVIDSDGSSTQADVVVAKGSEPDWGPAAPSDPSISASGTAVSGTEGAGLSSVVVATFTDADAGAVPSDYSATIDWGDGASSTGSIGGTAGDFSVTGSHTYAKYGDYAVTTQITDLDNPGDTATATSTATIADAPLSASGKGTVVSPSAFSAVVASFTDGNLFGQESEFSASIDWGDGSSPTSGAVSSTGGAQYDVSGSHAYGGTGSFQVTVKIASEGGSKASADTTVLVYEPPARGSFVIGDGNSTVGSHVTFWGSQWSKANSSTGGALPPSFKGFASSLTAFPGCGQEWSSMTGNSSPAPSGPLPAYMAVIVSSRVQQNGSTTSGDTPHEVVVRTDPGYAPDPAFPGTGTVVAVVC